MSPGARVRVTIPDGKITGWSRSAVDRFQGATGVARDVRAHIFGTEIIEPKPATRKRRTKAG